MVQAGVERPRSESSQQPVAGPLGDPPPPRQRSLFSLVQRRGRLLDERAEGPGDKVLSARLKDLEKRGLIVRHVAPGPPVRVTYELSDKGRAFGQVAEAINRWGEKLAR